jgi:hypothetical protein
MQPMDELAVTPRVREKQIRHSRRRGARRYSLLRM